MRSREYDEIYRLAINRVAHEANAPGANIMASVGYMELLGGLASQIRHLRSLITGSDLFWCSTTQFAHTRILRAKINVKLSNIRELAILPVDRRVCGCRYLRSKKQYINSCKLKTGKAGKTIPTFPGLWFISFSRKLCIPGVILKVTRNTKILIFP